MTSIDAVRELATSLKNGKVPTAFAAEATLDDVRQALEQGIRELSCDFNAYRRNKLDIFEIMQELFEDTVPPRIIDKIGAFAEIRQVPDNVKTVFKKKVGRNRAKTYVTRAAVSGVYETFRLDTENFELEAQCYGGAFQIDFNRFICGEEDLNDYNSALMEGFEDKFYTEVYKCLTNAYNSTKMPAANKGEANGWNATTMETIVNTVKAYGKGAVIFATPRFISAMGPDAMTTATTYYGSWVPQSDLEEIKKYGFVQTFRGTPIVPIENSFVDEKNTAWQLDDQFAFVLPTGGDKVVKVKFEGNTIVKDWENRDNSYEIQAYKKFGVGILTYNNWGIYKNKDL